MLWVDKSLFLRISGSVILDPVLPGHGPYLMKSFLVNFSKDPDPGGQLIPDPPDPDPPDPDPQSKIQ